MNRSQGIDFPIVAPNLALALINRRLAGLFFRARGRIL